MSTFPFDGMTVVVTGNVPGLERSAATAAVTRLGGKSMGSVSGKTSLVVIGEGAGVSKTAKVRQHNILVMAAADFAALAADPASWNGAPVGVPLDALPASAVASGEPEPVAEQPWSKREHMVGVASAPSASGGVEYRCWCRCGMCWLGSAGDTLRAGCPADASSAAHRATGGVVDADMSADLRTRWGVSPWVDRAGLLRVEGEAAEAALAESRETGTPGAPADLLIF